MKKLLLLMMLMLVLGLTGRAAEKTMTITSSGSAYSVNGGKATGNTITSDDGIVSVNLGDCVLKSNYIQFLQDKSITIKVNSGKNSALTYVSLNFTTSEYGSSLVSSTTNGVTFTKPSGGTQMFWENKASTVQSITLKHGAGKQARISRIEIRYNGEEDTQLKDPGLFWTQNSNTTITSLSAELGDNAPYVWVHSKTAGSDFYNFTYTYSSSNPAVATIDDAGQLYLVGAGTTEISAIFAGNETYKAQTIKYTLTVTAPQINKCADPVFTPAGGTYNVGQKVTITCSTPGATITYMCGDDYGEVTSGYVYTFSSTGTYTLEAVASADGYEDSQETTAQYVITAPKCATPTFDKPAGTYTPGTTFNVNCTTPGAKVTLTYDGKSQTAAPGPFTLNNLGTYKISAVANADGYLTSDETNITYIIALPVCATPVITPSTGTYEPGKEVTFTCSTEGAKMTIFVGDNEYTDVTSPYSIILTDEGTYDIMASANADGYTESETADGQITIKQRPDVAPVITFSVAEGNVKGDSESVVLQLNDDCYPEAEVYYTLDARRAHTYETEVNDDHRIKYTLGDVITINPTDLDCNINEVTINAYAVNRAGEYTTSATYTFGAKNEPGTSTWEKLTDPSTLKDGDRIVLVGYNQTKNTYHAMGNTEGKDFINVVNANVSDNILILPETAQILTLKKSENNWILYTDIESNTYLYTTKEKFLKSGKNITGEFVNVALIAKSNKTTDTNDEMVIKYDLTSTSSFQIQFNPTSPRFSCYKATMTNPIVFRENVTPGEVITPAADYYLVMHQNIWNNNEETAVPFRYDETKGYYTLDISTIPGQVSGQENYKFNEDGVGGFAGKFYVRDGKADHTGVHFAPVTVGRSAQSAVSFIADNDGKVHADILPVDNNAEQKGLVHDGPTMFSTEIAGELEGQPIMRPIAYSKGTLILQPKGDAPYLEMQVEKGGITGVENITAEGSTGEAVYYNLQGVKVDGDNLTPGIYVRRQGNTATKVMVK